MVWMDGRVVALEDARIPVLDHGFLYGDSVYEAVRTYGGRPFLLEEHLARLEHSARGLHIPMPTGVREAVAGLLAADVGGERLLRIIVTRGEGAVGYAIDPDQTPRLVVLSLPVPSYPGEWYERGVRLAVVSVRRNPHDSLNPRLKTSNLLNLRLAFMEARELGADDAVLLNHDGDVAEASGSNVFVVVGGRLVTPPVASGILEGITRRFVLGLAGDTGTPAEERRVALDDLYSADEVFLTSTTRAIMPATRVDGRSIGSGVPGPITKRLMREYEERVGR